MLIRIRGWNIRVEYIDGLVSGAVSEPVFRVKKITYRNRMAHLPLRMKSESDQPSQALLCPHSLRQTHSGQAAFGGKCRIRTFLQEKVDDGGAVEHSGKHQGRFAIGASAVNVCTVLY